MPAIKSYAIEPIWEQFLRSAAGKESGSSPGTPPAPRARSDSLREAGSGALVFGCAVGATKWIDTGVIGARRDPRVSHPTNIKWF
jgi:hypothetical protein